MTFDEFISSLYHCNPNTPRCGHCGRPLVPVNDREKIVWMCAHCAWIREQDKKDDFWNPRTPRRLSDSEK